MTHENKERYWYAVGTDGYLYCLGDCGDFEEAEQLALDTIDCGVVWVLDTHFAKQWHDTLKGKDK